CPLSSRLPLLVLNECQLSSQALLDSRDTCECITCRLVAREHHAELLGDLLFGHPLARLHEPAAFEPFSEGVTLDDECLRGRARQWLQLSDVAVGELSEACRGLRLPLAIGRPNREGIEAVLQATAIRAQAHQLARQIDGVFSHTPPPFVS